MLRKLRREEYTVGWICALPVELAAAQEMLDEEHDVLERDDNDENLYSLGSIEGHNVVIVCLPAGQMGNNPAAAVAVQMKATFRGLRFGLMVGIGGGVPSVDIDIRLGDVVVSQPERTFGGVVQYDLGKATPSGFNRTGSLNSPPQILLGAVAKVRANEFRGRSRFSEHFSQLSRIPKFQHAGPDILFEAMYDHEGGQTCRLCSREREVDRQQRESKEVVVHYGIIASGNQVIRDGKTRDTVSRELGGILCFEMEAAGLMNRFPCLVIRGICDYADSHKNKSWQAYAAGTAAAYAKELLSVIPQAEVGKTQTAADAMNERVRTSSYYLPFSRNRRFVGRSDELEELRQKLLVNKECQKIAVVGLGGIGKTQVVLEFAQSVKKEKPEYSIFWVPALSLESFEQACTEIVRILPIARAAKAQAAEEKVDAKELVRPYLSAHTAGKWLLIVDNADDTNVVFGTTSSKGIVDYLPESEDGLTIFTSRRQEVAESLVGGDGDVLKLGKMSDEDAVVFIQSSLVQKDLAQDNAIMELLTELDYLPLAIAQAVAYIKRNGTTFAGYLRLLKNTDEDIITLMSREFRDSTRYRQSANAVATTWVVSFNQILKEDTTAADLLAFISCIEWKAIPRSILPTVQPEARMVDAIGTICSYSFMVKRDNKEVYDMHRLVHLAIRIWLDRDGRRVGIRKKAIEHVAEVFPSNDYENRHIWREYLPHTSQLLIVDQEDSAKAKHKDSAEAKHNLLWKVRRCLQTDGRMREAVRWFEESCQWADDLPEDHPSRLASQHALAEAYRANGQIREAVALLEHVVAVQKRVLAVDHPNQLGSQHELAFAYRANGQVKEAVALLEHVVAVREQVLARDHHERLSSQHALALMYRANGQVKKAVALLEHVFTVYKQVLAEDHPDRLASQHALAVAYQANGQVKEAVALLEHVVAAHKQMLPEDHPDRLGSQLNLARGYRANGQVKEAVALLENVVAAHKQVLAEDHPDRLLSQHALALAYQANGQVKEAVALLKHVVNKHVLAEDHPDQLVSQHALALAYQANGQVKEAVALLKYVVVARERVLSEDHPDRLESQHALANMMQTDR